MSIIANDFIDFYYCGHTMSEYDGIIGDIDGGSAVSPVEIGSVLNLNPVEIKPLKKRKSVTATYDEYVESQFSFFKNPCSQYSYYTREEVIEIIRWLNQPRYEKFYPVYSDTSLPSVYYYASFNVQPIIYIGRVIGFQLSMTTNAPFGYYDEVTFEGTGILTFQDPSDEQGFIFPTCSLTASEDGHLILTNSRNSGYRTIVGNCKAGEIVTLNGEFGTITTSVPHPNLYDDFNYVFPKVWNKMNSDGTDNRTNIFTLNFPQATVSITYSPISKFGLI